MSKKQHNNKIHYIALHNQRQGMYSLISELISDPTTTAKKQYICPLSKKVMNDPVTISDGYTFERVNIQEWFTYHDTNPITGVCVQSKVLYPNLSIKSLIEKQIKVINKEDCFVAPELSISKMNEQQIKKSQIEILVRNLNNKTLCRKVSKHATILDLKLILQQSQGHPPQDIFIASSNAITHQVKVLPIYSTLQQCGVKNGDTLHILLRFNSAIDG